MKLKELEPGNALTYRPSAEAKQAIAEYRARVKRTTGTTPSTQSSIDALVFIGNRAAQNAQAQEEHNNVHS